MAWPLPVLIELTGVLESVLEVSNLVDGLLFVGNRAVTNVHIGLLIVKLHRQFLHQLNYGLLSLVVLLEPFEVLYYSDLLNLFLHLLLLLEVLLHPVLYFLLSSRIQIKI